MKKLAVICILCTLGSLAVAQDRPQGPSQNPSALTIARLKYGGGGDWYSNPSSLPNLLKALKERTSVAVEVDREARVEIMAEELFDYPMLYMNGHGTVKFTRAEVERLRRYLTSGGFLWADDNYGMDKSFRKEMARVFPDSPLVEIPFSHDIYHVFYDFPNGLPKIHEHDGGPAQGFGIFYKGRLVVFYTFDTDIGDGIEDADVHGDPPDKREAAMKTAVNVVLYAMTH
jgi:hypothetical protein